MRWPELLFVVLFLHFARNVLHWVVHVLGEWTQRFVVSNLGRVRRPERLVVLHQRWRLGSSLALRVWPIFTDDRHGTIEELSLFRFLGETLSLVCLYQKSFSGLTLLRGQLFWAVEVVFYVRDHSSKASVLTDFTEFRRVSLHVSRLDHDLTVFLVSEMLLHLLVILHVLEGRVCWLPDVLARSEWFLITNFNLPISVLFAQHGGGRVLERIADGIVGGLHEEDLVAGTLFHGTSPDIGRIDDDFFDFRVRSNSGCAQSESKDVNDQFQF